VYVVGQYTSAACTFGSFEIVNRGTKVEGLSSRDGFLVKLRTDGVFQWAVSAGGADEDYATAVRATPLHSDVLVPSRGQQSVATPTGCERMGFSTLQALQEPILLLPLFSKRARETASPKHTLSFERLPGGG
jgi:hypothetical protein